VRWLGCAVGFALAACHTTSGSPARPLATAPEQVSISERELGFPPSSILPKPGAFYVAGPSALAEWSISKRSVVRRVAFPSSTFGGDKYDLSVLGTGLVVVSSVWNLDGAAEVRAHLLDREWGVRSVVVAQNARGAQHWVHERVVYIVYAVHGGTQSVEVKLASLDAVTGRILRIRDLGLSDAQVVDRTLADVVVLNGSVYVGWVGAQGFDVGRYDLDLAGPAASWHAGRPTAFRPRLAPGANYLYVVVHEDAPSPRSPEVVALNSDLHEVRRVRFSDRFGFQMAFAPDACAFATSGAEVFDGRSVRPLLPLEAQGQRSSFEDVRASESTAYFVRQWERSVSVSLVRLPRATGPCPL